MAPRKADAKIKRNPRTKRALKTEPVKPQVKRNSILHFGESYSSLLLGIVVVVITTILLIFLVRDRSALNKNDLNRKVTSVNTQKQTGRKDTLTQNNISPTITTAVATTTLAPTLRPTVKPALTTKPALKATVIPSPTVKKVITAKPTVTAQKPTVTPEPTKVIAQAPNTMGTRVHTVSKGETLWAIAERYYKSGYNWVDIARVNNLSNPDQITSNMKLTIPNVPAKIATVTTVNENQTVFGPKITGTTYSVKKGDHLWGIAVRAYSDGYKWTEIARVNNISSPNVITPGMVLKIPRTSDLGRK